ncbi:glycosyltransferase family 4 protein [Candidatus Wolfebacteria bacterium]|nr:glycosyltransferase family 4 protein [Candidatus Wolfebacteria bacterium]
MYPAKLKNFLGKIFEMKICFIAHNLDIGNGDGRFAFSLIETLQRDFGVETSVFVERGQKELLGAKAVLHARGAIKKFILNPILIAKSIKGEKVDVIHAFDAWPRGVWAFFASLLAGIPFGMTIYATYGTMPLTKFFKGFLLRWAYKKSALNAAISQITAERIERLAPKVKVKVINQGIDFQKYQGQANHQRITNEPYILTVAYMKFRKGFHIAIPVFAEVKKTFPKLKYVVRAAPSDAKYFEEIKKMAFDLGVGKDIIWLPYLEESGLIDVYKNAEVFFFPALYSNPFYFEGFAATPMEAQACGIPVVKTKMSDKKTGEEIIDNETGILVEENNVGEAAEALKKILGDKNLRKKFSKNAVEFARSLDWKLKAREYLDYYQKIK